MSERLISCGRYHLSQMKQGETVEKYYKRTLGPSFKRTPKAVRDLSMASIEECLREVRKLKEVQ